MPPGLGGTAGSRLPLGAPVAMVSTGRVLGRQLFLILVELETFSNSSFSVPQNSQENDKVENAEGKFLSGGSFWEKCVPFSLLSLISGALTHVSSSE